MRVERTVSFGPGRILSGVVTEPSTTRSLPPIVLINAGVVHHVGPFRLYVDMARSFAEAGFPVLRFDLSGLGDSGVRSESVDARERASQDIRQATELALERWPSQGVVLAGLCSGACHAHNEACADDRVLGALLIDGFAFRTPGYLRRRTLRFAGEPSRWVRSARSLVPIPSSGTDDGGREPDRRVLEEGFFDPPEPGKLRREVEELVERGSRLLFVFTDGADDVNAAEQVYEMYPRLRASDRVETAYFVGGHHTFPLPGPRALLVERCTKWARSQFGCGPCPGGGATDGESPEKERPTS